MTFPIPTPKYPNYCPACHSSDTDQAGNIVHFPHCPAHQQTINISSGSNPEINDSKYQLDQGFLFLRQQLDRIESMLIQLLARQKGEKSEKPIYPDEVGE